MGMLGRTRTSTGAGVSAVARGTVSAPRVSFGGLSMKARDWRAAAASKSVGVASADAMAAVAATRASDDSGGGVL